MHRYALAERRLGIRQHRAASGLVATARPEGRKPEPAADKAGDAGREHDQRERHMEKEDGDKGHGRNSDHDVIPQRAAADADDRLHDDGEHRRLQPEKQTGDDGDVTVSRIDIAETEDR